MKKYFTFAAAAICAAAAWAQSSPYEGIAPGNIESGKDYYLYNVESGLWLQNNDRKANDWHTRGQLGTRGLDFTLNASGDGYLINAKFGRASLNRDNYYLDANDDHVWVFETVDGSVSNAVTIKSDTKYLTADKYTAGFGYNNNYNAGTQGEDQWYLNNPDNSTNGTWQIVTKAERLEKMLAAGETEAQDATWLVQSPDFANNDTRYSAWTRTGTWARGGDANGDWGRGSMIMESWNSGNEPHMYQTVTLPNGRYALTVQGFYRDGNVGEVGGKYNNGTEEIRAKYYINDVEKNLRSIIDGHSEALNSPDRWRVNTGGWYVPDNMADCSRCMNISNGYQNDAIEVKVTTGSAKIGVYKTGSVGGDWVIFDNFKLTYLGPIDVSEVLEGLNKAIAAAEAFTGQTTDVLAQELANKLAEANNKTSSLDADEISGAASALSTALDNAKAVNVSVLAPTVALAKADGIDVSAQEEYLQTGTSTDVADRLRLVRNLRKLNAIEKVDISKITCSEPANEEADYYLYNVGAGIFLSTTADWGTHIALDNPGMLVHFVPDGEWSGAAGRPVFHLSGNGWNGMNWSEEYWDKNGENKLAFVPVEGKDKVYNLCEWDAYNWHFVYDPAEDVCDGNTHYWNSVQKRNWNVDDYKNNPYAQWMLVSPAAYKAAMEIASAEEPLDVTYLIENPNFTKAHPDGKDNWNRGWTGIGGQMRGTDREPWMVIEWFEASADMKQTLTDLTPGKYEVSCYGFYRDGNSDHEATKVKNGETLIQNAFLTANDEQVALPNVTSAAGKMPGIGETRDGVAEFACWPWQANEYFQTGLYKVSVPVTVGADGNLTIGIKSDYNGETGSWVVVGNFRLTSLGATPGENVTISSAQWATYVPEKGVDFSSNEDVKAYTVTEIHNGYVKMQEVEKVPAGQAVLVNGARGNHFVNNTKDAPALEDNLLSVSDGVEVTEANKDYVLAQTATDAVFSGTNLLDGMTYDQYWWYAPGWGQIANPTTTVEAGTHTLVLPSATSDQWQAQYHLQNTGIALSKDKKYDFKVVINSNKAFTGATIKLTQNDNDDLHIVADRVALKEGENVFTYTGLETNEAEDITNLKFAYDFGGNPEGTEVSISGMYLQENTTTEVGFYPVKVGTTIAAGKGYLEVPAAGVKFYSLFGEDDPTALKGIIVEKLDGTVETYNLAGQRVNKAQNGIFIQNGKKVLK